MSRALLLSCLGFAACISEAPPTQTQRFPTGDLKDSVVYIQSCGTGWMVRPQFVVTNRHVADCVKERTGGVARVVFARGYRVLGSVFSTSTGRYVDLALIRLRHAVGAPRLRVAEGNAVRDADVLLSIGNPTPAAGCRRATAWSPIPTTSPAVSAASS